MRPRDRLVRRRLSIVETLPPLTEVVRGSLVERYLRCGKPTCHCARSTGHRVFYLTVSFAGGRTEQLTVPLPLVPAVRRWLRNYARWWDGLEKVSAINRQLLRRRWLDAGAAPRRRRE